MKIVKIDRCPACPSSDYDSKGWYCRELQTYVGLFGIHPDCPLEDAKETDDADRQKR